MNKCRAGVGLVLGALLSATNLGAAEVSKNTLVVHADLARHKISRYIYGNFSEHLGSCIYGGIWVGPDSAIPNTRGIRNDVVSALRKIKLPVLRWPGGCFADEYHWKDGVGPYEKRPSIVNTNWGGVTETNHFGTHEFLDFCEQVGCEPYVSGNVGSGTPQELEQWVEYMTFDGRSPMADFRRVNGRDKPWRLRFLAIGNENWGCGGNMRPEYYADVYRRFQTFARDYSGNRLYKIACGAGSEDYAWTEAVMKSAGSMMSGLSLHHYIFESAGPATQFGPEGWFRVLANTLKLQTIVDNHARIMDKYDPARRVGLIVDEWGTWYPVEPGTNPAFLYQQNTLRDALVAATSLNIFNNRSERVRMANIAQLANVLQAVILTRDEKLVLTPTYHVYDLYQVHQDALFVPTEVAAADYTLGGDKIPAVNASASLSLDGTLHISLVNLDHARPAEVRCRMSGIQAARVSGRVLTAELLTAHNTFDKPDELRPEPFKDVKRDADGLLVTMPAKSVVVLEVGGVMSIGQPAKAVGAVAPGLRYDYYEGEWRQLPELASLTPVRSGVSEAIALPTPNRGGNFGARYTGYLKVPSDGLYSFYTTSDDGSRLLVDDAAVVDNDGTHGPVEASGEVFLKAGLHSITVLFFQATGGESLVAEYEGPGVARQTIPAGALFHAAGR